MAVINDAKKIFQEAYRLLDTLTPLPIDCGQLCGAACCSDGGHEDAGMYLYYGEEKMYTNTPEWVRIEKSDFTYGEDDTHALIAMCNGSCDRKLRPLSCRIFPLIPYKKPNSQLRIIMDPRAKAMCPLAKTMTEDGLDENFLYTVYMIFRVLIRENHILSFVEEQSLLLDEYMQFFKI